jgi:hypothetical protein
MEFYRMSVKSPTLRLIAFPLLVLIGSFQPASAIERGDALARALAVQLVDAYGGQEALEQIDRTNYKDIGKVIQYSTISGAANTFDCEVYSKGEKTRVSMNFMGESVVTGFDGQHGWIQQGDQVFKPHPLAEKTIRMK